MRIGAGGSRYPGWLVVMRIWLITATVRARGYFDGGKVEIASRHYERGFYRLNIAISGCFG